MQFYGTHHRNKPQTEKQKKKIITEQLSAALSICVKKILLCLRLPNSKNTMQNNLHIFYLNEKTQHLSLHIQQLSNWKRMHVF